MGGQQMTPDTAKLKCKNFLATLLRLASEQPQAVANNVRALIQGLIDGKVEPEEFTSKLQRELNSSPQPCLVPFLKKSLPFLQDSLRNGELTIDGVRPPPLAVPQQVVPAPMMAAVPRVRAPMAVARPGMVSHQQQINAAALAAQQLRQLTPSAVPVARPQQMRHMMPQAQRFPQTVTSHQPFTSVASTAPKLGSLHPPSMPIPTAMSAGALPGSMPSMSSGLSYVHPSIALAAAKEKKSAANTFSTAGDEDINDVASMAGVNLAEESQRMQQGGTDLIGTQIRSCKDEIFLKTGNLSSRISKMCADRGLDEPGPEIMAMMSHATQDRLKTIMEKLSVIAEHRMDVIRLEGESYEVTQDVKGQVRFLSDLDRLEKTRHEQAERQRLMMAARSRTKTDDPEKEKLKEKAKELQRLEEEQMLQEKANSTALLAIGAPRKKARLDDATTMAMMSGSKPVGQASAAAANAAAQLLRPKTKRVHQRDLMFLMEQEKELKRSATLWKAYIS